MSKAQAHHLSKHLRGLYWAATGTVASFFERLAGPTAKAFATAAIGVRISTVFLVPPLFCCHHTSG